MRNLNACVLLIVLGVQAFCFAQTEISLNGQWEIIFDETNEGRSAAWHKDSIFQKHPDKQKIQVPSSWELIKQDYEGVGFYRHEFQVPADWKDKVIRMHFGAVNYLSEFWLNDEVVGFHEGGFAPFEFRVDELLKFGEKNVLNVRVVGPILLSDKEVDGVKPLETPQWRGGISGGIWQEVQLMATDAVYVDDVFIEPRIGENTAIFHVELDHTAIKGVSAELEIRITSATDSADTVVNTSEKWELHPGKNKKDFVLKIPDAEYWSPANPHLYKAEVRVIVNGKVSDAWSERFGMRELTLKNKDFYLNGKRIYIKATFFEGLYPNGIAYPDSEEMARTEIRLAKEAGFNMIRPWRHPPTPMWLDLADEMGVLVVGSPALECMQLPLSTPYLSKRVENEVTQTILRDRNRASIVQWELFNELHRPVLKQLMRPMAMVTRTLDPTRLILDESGGWAFGANMYLPNEYEPTQFNDIHNYPGPFIDKDKYDGYLSIGLTEEEKKAKGYKGKTPGRNVVPGLMSFVSELGYGSLPDLTVNNPKFEKDGNSLTPAYRYHKRLAEEQEALLIESGFKKLYPNMQQFYLDQQSIHGAANKRMIEAVRSNPEVDGYCIHALAAGDWILGAGLIDLWRNPKSYAYEATKAANQPQLLSIRAEPRNVYAEKGLTLSVNGINELGSVNGNLELKISSSSGEVVYSKEKVAEYKSGVSSLFDTKINTSNWEGSYRVTAKMTAPDGTILNENFTEFDVFSTRALQVPKTKIAVLDVSNTLSSFLKISGIKTINFSKSMDISVPVLVTATVPTSNSDKKRFSDLEAFVQKGGTVVYVEGTKEDSDGSNPLFPFSVNAHSAVGLWTCIPHMVHEHPIFKGLPSNGMMRNIYENVWPMTTLRDLKGNENTKVETLVGTVAFDWFSKEHKMNYSGPGASWWGSDMAIVPSRKGRYLISQLRLVENLGKDPIADKILFNMITYLVKN
ncbi:hypothetical protein FEE95_20325 [Maribacter algarum]|uniref:Beta-galactosidase n=1 Tax=Maribacter algarum (ex Zhang et al. 2020) TaxID=2578118 RepID=A0A5S3PJ88_9FLAO|nr:sugar-binding domain-containing protein [Maribacter algarum]TMM53409.1 hypothetical protein FEE95_20325 [Maribacter algarum]